MLVLATRSKTSFTSGIYASTPHPTATDKNKSMHIIMDSSSVYFKFKSQREPTRVEFDGTSISVFDLKRQIVLRSGLGDGSDFDLSIFADEAMRDGMLHLHAQMHRCPLLTPT